MRREGSVKQAADGTWGFVVDISPSGARRRQVRRRGFRTKGEAQRELTKALGERRKRGRSGREDRG